MAGLAEYLGAGVPTGLHLVTVEIRCQALCGIAAKMLFTDRACPPSLIAFHRENSTSSLAMLGGASQAVV